MSDDTVMHEAIKEAVEIAGGQTELGKLVGKSQGHVWAWVNRDRKCAVPMVLEVERATGVSRHKLRPDIYPPASDVSATESAA